MINDNNLIEILNNILKNKDIKEVAENLNITKSTIKRWIELNNIPKLYTFELMKIANINIDYSKFNYKDKDQFYTPIDTAKKCYNIMLNILKEYNENLDNYIFIEPSAGNGNFLNILPKDRRIGIDIESKNEEIIICDFLKWLPNNIEKKYIVIGNPPFGLRGQLALKFILHSYNFADYVCFILPQLFESDGKGVPRKRVIGYNLIHSEKINSKFEEPNGKKINIECIFQIWSKNNSNDKYILKKKETSIKIYSLSDGGTPSTTRNKKMFNKCHIYIPSTCYGKDNMKYYDNFNKLPNKKGYGIIFNNNKEENIEKFKKIKWNDIAFLSTNSAYNIRTSQIIEQLE